MVDQPPFLKFSNFDLNHHSSSPSFHYNQLHSTPPLSIPHSPPTTLLQTPLIPANHFHITLHKYSSLYSSVSTYVVYMEVILGPMLASQPCSHAFWVLTSLHLLSFILKMFFIILL